MFDPKRPVQTRDGRKARIICTDAKVNEKPIIALVAEYECSEVLRYYWHNGQYFLSTQKEWDLVNVRGMSES